jgi:hypothetical protein
MYTVGERILQQGPDDKQGQDAHIKVSLLYYYFHEPLLTIIYEDLQPQPKTPIQTLLLF